MITDVTNLYIRYEEGVLMVSDKLFGIRVGIYKDDPPANDSFIIPYKDTELSFVDSNVAIVFMQNEMRLAFATITFYMGKNPDILTAWVEQSQSDYKFVNLQTVVDNWQAITDRYEDNFLSTNPVIIRNQRKADFF